MNTGHDSTTTSGEHREPSRLRVLAAADRPRDLADERTITALAVCGEFPLSLVSMAERRAPQTPITRFSDRDFCEEIKEELADARNYAAWATQRLEDRGPVSATGDTRRLLDDLTYHLAYAFALAERAQQLIAEDAA